MAGSGGLIAHCAATLLAAAVLAGCGGPSDEQRVRQTITDFGRAVARGDYARICTQLLAPRLTEQLQRVNLPCEAALRRGFGSARDPRLTVGAVQVHGEQASAQVRSSAVGEQPSEDTLDLVKVSGRWRISALAKP